MAYNVEPMDIDHDFDNKENTFHHSNVLPCTEKGYEELDVSELNMKLRYSTTPLSSPMSKSYTANCLDNANFESADDFNGLDNMNLSRSFNSMLSKNDYMSKSCKAQPLQLHSADHNLDNNRNTSVCHQPLSTTLASECNKIIASTTEANNINDNSFPVSPSSVALTPEATKELSKNDGTSPIMRGLKSMLNIFRSSQSPIPPAECDSNDAKHDISGPEDTDSPKSYGQKPQATLSSTPIAAHKSKDRIPSKQNSPHKDGVVFNDDLEKDLLWKDETTILFDGETIPKHKLFLQQSKPLHSGIKESEINILNKDLNETVEFMDISYNDAAIQDKTIIDLPADPSRNNVADSDGEFVDCETTFTNQSDLFPCEENKYYDNLVAVGSETNKLSEAMPIMHNITRDIGTDFNVNLSGSQPTITSVKFSKEPLDRTSLESAEKLATSATFTKETLDTSVSLEFDDRLISSSTFAKDNKEVISTQSKPNSERLSTCTDVNTSKDIHFNANSTNESIYQAKSTAMTGKFIKEVQKDTILLNPTQSPLGSVTFIKDMNDDIDHINEAVTFDPTEKCILSGIFTNNSFDDVETQFNVKEALNATMTFSPAEKETTKDNTQNVKDQFEENYDKVPLDTTESIDPTEKTLISVMGTNVNAPESEAQFNANLRDEHLDSNMTVDSNKISVAQSEVEVYADVDIAKDILDQTDIIGQIDKILLSDTINKNDGQFGAECLQTSLDSTATMASADKSIMSGTFIKDITQDREFHCIDNFAGLNRNNVMHTRELVDIAVDLTGTLATSTFLYEDTNISQSKIEPETLCVQNVGGNVPTEAIDSSKVILKIQEINNPVETIEVKSQVHTNSINSFNLGQLAVENTDQRKTNNPILDTLEYQVNTNFRETSLAALNPDILQSNTYNYLEQNDVSNKVDIDRVELLTSETVSKDPPETSMVSDMPTNIPLPDGDNTETKVATKSSITDNKNVSMILPDVINVHTSKAEDIQEVVEVLIDAPTEVKLTAYLINDTLLDKESVITTVKTEEVINVAQNNVKDSILGVIENKLEDKQLQGQINKITCATLAEDVQITESLTDNMNYDILSNNPNVYDNNFMEPDVSMLLVNNSLDQQISTKTEFVTGTKNIANVVGKSGNEEDININEVEFGETHNEAPMDINSSIFIENDERNIPHDTESVEVAVSNEQLKGDESQHIYETESHSNAMIPSSEVCQKDMSLDNIQVDNPLQINEIKDIDESVKHPHAIPTTQTNVKNEDQIHEEILDTENNSPYVLISVDKEAGSGLEHDFENIVNPFATKSKVSITPPSSPKIISKGYNFDFDDMEDPFATNLKIRMSPPLESPKILYKAASAKKASPNHNKNIRKTQSEKKKPVSTKRTGKVTLDPVSTKLNKMALANTENSQLQENVINELNINLTNLEVNDCAVSDVELKDISIDLNAIDKSELEINIDNTSKLDVVKMVGQVEVNENVDNKSSITSSSAATTSSDSIVTRNVFNLPEIDDMNFNPFATKSKIRKSPPPDVNITSLDMSANRHQNNLNGILTKNIDINQTSGNNKSGDEENDSASNCSTSCCTKTTDDKYLTVQEVHTDEEDTTEGPFLEDDELSNDKNCDFDNVNVDMLQFTHLPAQTNEDNEIFIDAEAFEFLLNQNKSNVVEDSGKESLFLKFDPLFAKRISSDGVVATLSKLQKRQYTPQKTLKSSQKNVNSVESPTAGPSTSNITLRQNTLEESVEDTNMITSKPMMVVTPAVNPVVAPRKLMTPANSNRRSITFTSPAIDVIDRLLSLSANNSLVGDDSTFTEVSREQNGANLALTQLRELLAEKEIHVYNLRSESKELRDRLTTLEAQMKSLESQSNERLKKVNEMTVKLSDKTKINKSMATVVEEYERTIASLIAEIEQDKKHHNDERIILIKERDEQAAHLASMEVSFSDLHSKYEKSKQLIFSCKANEDTYKKSIRDFEENLAKMQNNYELLKQHATSKLNHANQELEKMNRAHEAEVLKLNAMIKRKDLHITSLEETLAQKSKANEELTAICDELINKVG